MPKLRATPVMGPPTEDGTCRVIGCNTPAQTRELCRRDYWWFRAHDRDAIPERQPLQTPTLTPTADGTCWADGCNQRGLTRHLCGSHYNWFRTHATAELPATDHRAAKTIAVLEQINQHRAESVAAFIWDVPLQQVGLYGSVITCTLCGDQFGPVFNHAQSNYITETHRAMHLWMAAA